MKPILEYLNTKITNSKIKATNDTIHQIIKDELDRLGHDADLNHIDVSEVTKMNSLFSCHDDDLGSTYKDLNPDISAWDVSKVEDMEWMFLGCEKFNCDISCWDVGKVENMKWMFYDCENFNCDISSWYVSNVKDMSCMFFNCKKFNQDLSQWNIGKVKYHNQMFDDCHIKEEYKPKFKI